MRLRVAPARWIAGACCCSCSPGIFSFLATVLPRRALGLPTPAAAAAAAPAMPGLLAAGPAAGLPWAAGFDRCPAIAACCSSSSSQGNSYTSVTPCAALPPPGFFVGVFSFWPPVSRWPPEARGPKPGNEAPPPPPEAGGGVREGSAVHHASVCVRSEHRPAYKHTLHAAAHAG